jgi:hypothetical protein
MERVSSDQFRGTAVQIIPQNGIAQMGEMDAKLVGSPRYGLAEHQGVAISHGQYTVAGLGVYRAVLLRVSHRAGDEPLVGAVYGGYEGMYPSVKVGHFSFQYGYVPFGHLSADQGTA